MTTSPSLLGRTVVVAGGTGNVGEGVVRVVLRHGATVVVPSRSQERLDALAGSLTPELHTRFVGINASYGSFSQAAELASTISTRIGQVTDVVSLIGGWWSGKTLLHISDEDWQSIFIAPATAHMAIAHAFIPSLSPAGSYTALTGYAAKIPSPGSGLVSMQAAAQLMMRKVLSAEIKDGPRINDVVLGPIKTRSRQTGPSEWLTAEEVGEILTNIMLDDSMRNTQLNIQTRDSYTAFIKSDS